MLINKYSQHITELLSRNVEAEIAEFIESHDCDTAYQIAANRLMDHYIEQREIIKLKALATLGLADTFSLAKRAVKLFNLSDLYPLLPYVSDKNKLLLWSSHLTNDGAVKMLLDDDTSLRPNYIICYIAKQFNYIDIKKYLDKISDDEINSKVPDLISYASTSSSEDTLKYLISRGLDPHFNNGAPLVRALVGLNIPAIKFLISLEQPRRLSTVEKVKVKSAIMKNSTPFKFLKKLKEEEKSLITIALEAYFNQTTKSLLRYLKECPQWQKIHVAEYMQRNM
jgi:hypothetical protein